jgi:hypothetical protein
MDIGSKPDMALNLPSCEIDGGFVKFVLNFKYLETRSGAVDIRCCEYNS